MPSGGPRQGVPGGQYPNRSDMAQAPAAPRGQTYGQAGQQMQAQSVVPVAGAPTPGGGSQASPAQGPAQGPMPGEVPSLQDPSAWGDVPFTDGMSTGPGRGPEALLTATPPNPDLALLKGVYLKYGVGSPAGGEWLRRLIEFSEQNII